MAFLGAVRGGLAAPVILVAVLAAGCSSGQPQAGSGGSSGGGANATTAAASCSAPTSAASSVTAVPGKGTSTSAATGSTPTDRTVLNTSGSGNRVTGAFVIPSCAKSWSLSWGVTCSTAAQPSGLVHLGNLLIEVYKGPKPDPDDAVAVPVQQGQGVTEFSDTGAFSLHIGASCPWTVTVTYPYN